MSEVAMLKRLVQLRSNGLFSHEQRVGQYAGVLCRALNLDSGFSDAIRDACSLHDLGKAVIPDAILLKSAELTHEEWSIMRTHPCLGHEILKRGTDPISKLAASIALVHHESFDGSGYPNGLRGNQIPLEGRIAAICDVYDALREDRVYRRGLTHQAAMEIILEGDAQTGPTKFDPDLLRTFADQALCYDQVFTLYQAGFEHPVPDAR